MVASQKPIKSKASAVQGKTADVLFINWSLTKEEKADLKSRSFSLEECDDALLKACEAGYKVSVQFDDYNECYACFVTQRDKKGANFGYILTGRGSTPVKAIKQALYIGFYLMNGDFAAYSTKVGREEIDD